MTLCTRGVPLEARRRPGGRRESMYITITITISNPFFSFFFSPSHRSFQLLSKHPLFNISFSLVLCFFFCFFFPLGLSYVELLILCFFFFFWLLSNLCDILNTIPKISIKIIYGKKIQLLFSHRDIAKSV